MDNKILIGSRYFFNDIPGFKSKDIDELEIVDNSYGKFNYLMQLSYPNHCLFYLLRRSKNELIKFALDEKSPAMAVGKFLIPEFNKEFDITIDDLKLLQPMINRLDEKHAYEKIIFDAYIKNNDFTLTDEQRMAAYESYKAARPDESPKIKSYIENESAKEKESDNSENE